MNKTESELRELIGQRCKESGREIVANELDVSPQYISMLLRKENPRSISVGVAEKLGYERQAATTVVFVPKNSSH